MFSEQLTPKGRAVRAAQLYGPDDFNRADQSDDQLFYAKERNGQPLGRHGPADRPAHHPDP